MSAGISDHGSILIRILISLHQHLRRWTASRVSKCHLRRGDVLTKCVISRVINRRRVRVGNQTPVY